MLVSYLYLYRQSENSDLAPCVAVSKGRFSQHHFICDLVDGHGVDGYGHARIEKLIDRVATVNFESYLTQAIGRTCSGGFSIEENEHAVPGFILYKSFQNPICSVPDAEPQGQHYSWPAQWRFFELPGIETDCCNAKDYANYFRNHFHYAFQSFAIL
jgi:hypothetical protein